MKYGLVIALFLLTNLCTAQDKFKTTFAGFSKSPIVQSYYSLSENNAGIWCTVNVRTDSVGVSNSTYFKLTLPFAAVRRTSQQVVVFCNNGVNEWLLYSEVMAIAVVDKNSTILEIIGPQWIANGAKTANIINFKYLIKSDRHSE
jgi:hypothetical protein